MEHTTDTIGSLVESMVARRLHSFETLHATTRLGPEANALENLLLAEMDSLHSIVAPFARQLNYIRSPILRIPPEIFQLIITTTVRSIRQEKTLRNRDPRRWIVLGRVSHRFRVMLLAMHTLWGETVSSRHLRDARSFLLERAHNAPIDLTFDAHDEFVVRHLEQARSVYGYARDAPDIMSPLLEKLLAGTFSHLESLDLSFLVFNLDELSSYTQALGLHRTTVPYHQSAICAPKLRSLSLWNIFVPFQASSLISLTLCRQDGSQHGELLPSEHFMDMLRHCVNVQHLELEHHLPNINPLSTPLLLDRIHLPALRGISVIDTCDHIIPFWSFIELPASAILKLDIRGPHAASLDGTLTGQINAASVFASHISSPHLPSSTRLEINGWNVNWEASLVFHLTIPHGGPPNRYSRSTERPQYASSPHISIFEIALSSDDGWDALVVKQCVRMFVDFYRLSQIQSLDVACDVIEALAVGDAMQALALFPLLETLSINNIEPQFFRTLPEEQSAPPLPYLFSVLLHPTVHSLSLSSETTTLTAEDVHKLATLLRSRCENHIPIRALELVFLGEIGSDWESEDELPNVSSYHDTLVDLVVPGPLIIDIGSSIYFRSEPDV